MSTLTKVFEPKHPNEVIPLTFDFASLPGNVIPSATSPALVVTRVEGAADPSDLTQMLVGAPQIVGASVLQKIRGGVANVTYQFRCEVDTAEGFRWVLIGTLDVVPG